MKKRLFIDIHAIQTVPPSNINRDDTGSPKTAQYGGVVRSRVSSQAWKKAIRDYFHEFSDEKNVGIRSLDIVNYIAKLIMNFESNVSEEDAIKMANKTLNNAGIKTKDNRMRALCFIGAIQAENLAKAAIAKNDNKKELQNIFKSNPAIDIALFGRMVADDPNLNEDASSQVAHAISTHAVQTEFDFFTASDDLAPEDNAGAGMLGTVEYNSSTLYRYANVAIHELLNQLEHPIAVQNALKLFIEAFINSMPTGKSNTFANQTLPQAVILTVRRDRPVNLISAFEKPIISNSGYIKASIDKLHKEFKEVTKFVEEPEFTLTIGIPDLGEEVASLSFLLDTFNDKLSELIAIE